ncbi:MAG TPA: hypothetical protein VJS20_12400 [Gemmatimonadales bacterium]|nr:hypothetical protein [Gemmatimonadales bacterium]
MNARFTALFVGAAALLVGCQSNPTADGSGTATQVIGNFASFTMNPGDSAAVIVSIVDSRLTALPGTITFSTCNAAIATVQVDPAYTPVPATSMRAVIHAVNPTYTCVIASSGSLKPDTIMVGVLPVIYNSAFPATSAVGTAITVNAQTGLPFTSSTQITFQNGAFGAVQARSAASLTILVPFAAAGPLTINDFSVPYGDASNVLSNQTLTLNTSATFTPTGTDPYGAGKAGWTTAPDISSLIPAAPGNASFVTGPAAGNVANTCPEARFGFGPVGTCDLLKFTLAAPATLAFTVDWDSDPSTSDIDVMVCSDSLKANFNTTTFDPCIADGFAGASTAKPETAGGVTYPAGTYWLAVQNFAGTSLHTYFVTIVRS